MIFYFYSDIKKKEKKIESTVFLSNDEMPG